MRRNTINSTSGFKKDLKFGLAVPKNKYTRETRLVVKATTWEAKAKAKARASEAKAKAKDLTFEAKAKAKDLTSEAKAKAKDKLTWPRGASRPRPWPRGLHL